MNYILSAYSSENGVYIIEAPTALQKDEARSVFMSAIPSVGNKKSSFKEERK